MYRNCPSPTPNTITNNTQLLSTHNTTQHNSCNAYNNYYWSWRLYCYRVLIVFYTHCTVLYFAAPVLWIVKHRIASLLLRRSTIISASRFLLASPTIPKCISIQELLTIGNLYIIILHIVYKYITRVIIIEHTKERSNYIHCEPLTLTLTSTPTPTLPSTLPLPSSNKERTDETETENTIKWRPK